ncbi:substrate-binding domain-containing protein [Brachybacterium sp. YJGR34]
MVTTSPAAAVEGSAHPELGREFVDLLAGEEGRQVLREHGFGRP